MHESNMSGRRGQSRKSAIRALVWVVTLCVFFTALAFIAYNAIFGSVLVGFKANSTPTAEQQNLIKRAGLNTLGAALLINAHTSVEPKSAFTLNCPIENDKTVELGCYDPVTDKISLLSVSEPEIVGYEYTSAAHETLHSAYQKLSLAERLRIDALIAKQPIPQELNERLKLYPEGVRKNELHSFLGSEYGNLSPDLEAYYSRYFTNRQLVIAAAQKIRSTYKTKESAIAQGKKQLDSLETQIDVTTSNLNATSKSDVSEYNSWVRKHNDLVYKYNSLLPGYNQQVSDYNRLAESLKLNPTTYSKYTAQ